MLLHAVLHGLGTVAHLALDYPGATYTSAKSISPSGGVLGQYVGTDYIERIDETIIYGFVQFIGRRKIASRFIATTRGPLGRALTGTGLRPAERQRGLSWRRVPRATGAAP